MITRRVIGRITGAEAGPTLLVVAGLHGNEPAGIEAARRVFAALERDGAGVKGDFTALAGNLGALEAGVRFRDRDMNRAWDSGRFEALRAGSLPGVAEDREQVDLLEAIEAADAAARGPRYFIDLHTTSAEGVPFSMIRDIPSQIAFASRFGLPVIVGLLERIDGVLLDYMRTLGFVCLGVEGGRHDDPTAIDHHEAVLWTALAVTGMVPPASIPGLGRFEALLRAARGDLPTVTRVTHRHPVGPDDGFRMEPGFRNIQKIRTGELLARDRNGEIRASEAGLLLMPLYQAQGDDGFFLGRG